MSLSFRSSPFRGEPKRESFRIRFLLQKSAILSRGSRILLFSLILELPYFGHLLNSTTEIQPLIAAIKITVMVPVTYWRSCLHGKCRNTTENAEYARMFRF